MPLGFISDESQVNTTTTGNQRAPATAALGNGGYVTVWASDTGDGSGKAIMGQRFAADGTKVGSEFLVNTTTVGDQDLPDIVPVTADFDVPAGFVVVWQSDEGAGNIIRARRFLADGTPVRFIHTDPIAAATSDVVVSGTFGGSKPAAGAISLGSNRLAFVWEAPNGDSDGSAILMARYRPFALSAPVVVNSITAGNQVDPRVGSIGAGGMAIVWESQEPTGDVIRSITWLPTGPSTTSTVLSQAAGEDESLPSVGDSVAGQGGVMAIWNSGGTIYARRQGQGFGPVGDALVLNTTPGGVVGRSDVTGLSDGGYMVAYFTQSGDDGSSYSIRAEYFSSSNISQSAEFLVPQSFAGTQEAPSIIQLAGGNIVVTWASEADELGNFEIKQRLINLDAPAGTPGSDTINGTPGPDVLAGLGGNDTINGLGGNDLIDGGPGDDTMDGGADTDTVTYATATGPVTISLANTGPQTNGDAGTDTLVNFENATGSPLGDTLTGDGGPNVIDGGAGADTMTGGDGNDVYHVDVSGDTIVELAGEGVDEVRTGLASYTLAATLENLTATNAITHNFQGNGADNRITGGGGRDIVRADDGGADTLFGLGGSDTFYFGAAFSAADSVDGGDGADSILLQGDYSAGVTLGTGTVANVVAIETISLVPGHFTDFGGTGTSFYSYDITMLDANVATGAVFKVNGLYLRATENFTFDGSAETGGKFILLAGLGLDDLTGGGSNDLFIFGEDGRFGVGDRVVGGGGYDTVYLRGDYTIDFNAPAWADSLTGIEGLTLGGTADTAYISGGGDGEFDHSYVWNDAMLAGGTITINGSSLGAEENLSFDGRTEASAIFRLFGGSGVDVLRGGGAADFIYGGDSGDTLQGNGGNDRFVYYSVSESNVSNLDGIQDFTLGDLIDLLRIDANSLVDGDQAFTFVTGAFTGPGQLRVVGTGGLVTVEANVNGDTLADLSIAVVVADLHTLTATDFLL